MYGYYITKPEVEEYYLTVTVFRKDDKEETIVYRSNVCCSDLNLIIFMWCILNDPRTFKHLFKKAHKLGAEMVKVFEESGL